MTTHSEMTAELKLRSPAGLRSLPGQRRLLRLGLLWSDATMLGLAFLMAYGIRFGLALPVFRTEVVADLDFYSRVVFGLIPLWLLIFLFSGLYDERNLLSGTREYALVFNAVSVGMLLVIVATFLKPDFVVARAWLLMSWLLAFLWVGGARFWVRRLVALLRVRGYFLAPALIVGTNDEALALAEQLAHPRYSGLRMLGFISAEPQPEQRVFRNLFLLGHLGDLERLVDRFGVEEVVVATSAVSRPQLVDVFRQLAARPGVQLRLSSGLFEIMTTKLQVKELASVSLVNVAPVRLTGLDVALKMALDFLIAVGALILLSPVFLAIAVAVRLDSAGPIVHRRRVLGMGGTAFDAFKFRTMVVDGDAVLARHPQLGAELARHRKLRADPRITRVGRTLRKYSLDELPQLVNVLLGQMSIVGPRMISPDEQAAYGQWDMNLLTVKPGITGLWQVSGRSDVSYEERVRLDMSYIRNWTIWRDLHILLQTIPAVLRGRGAY
jgi:exopolysaccharide biosynthesis polyprenyl glycosylphosphotransferase